MLKSEKKLETTAKETPDNTRSIIVCTSIFKDDFSKQNEELEKRHKQDEF